MAAGMSDKTVEPVADLNSPEFVALWLEEYARQNPGCSLYFSTAAAYLRRHSAADKTVGPVAQIAEKDLATLAAGADATAFSPKWPGPGLVPVYTHPPAAELSSEYGEAVEMVINLLDIQDPVASRLRKVVTDRAERLAKSVAEPAELEPVGRYHNGQFTPLVELYWNKSYDLYAHPLDWTPVAEPTPDVRAFVENQMMVDSLPEPCTSELRKAFDDFGVQVITAWEAMKR